LVSVKIVVAFYVIMPPSGLMYHSDRGSQYTSDAYGELAKQHGIEVSMSHRENCWDTAVVESFFSSLKKELGLIHGRFDSRVQAQREITEYIEAFYNHERLPSIVGSIS